MIVLNKGSRAAAAEPSIELTPIIDMVFLLLIFFLVATTFQQAEREMQIVLPETEHGGPISLALRDLVINVAADGSVVVGGRAVDLPTLDRIVQDALQVSSDQKVTVRGDASASYEAIVRVLDVCKGAGVQEPFLDTVPLR